MRKKAPKSGRAVKYLLCLTLSDLSDQELYAPSFFAHRGVQSGQFDTSNPKELFQRIRNFFFRLAKLYSLPRDGDGYVQLPSQTWEVAWFGSRWKSIDWTQSHSSPQASKRSVDAGDRNGSKRPGFYKYFACIDHLEDEVLYTPALLAQLTRQCGFYQQISVYDELFFARVRISFARFMLVKEFPKEGDGWIMLEGLPKTVGWSGRRWKLAWSEHQGKAIPSTMSKKTRPKRGAPFKYAACFTCIAADRLYSATCMAEIGIKLEIYKQPGGKLWRYRKMRYNFTRFARTHLPAQADGFVTLPNQKLEPAWFGRRWRDAADPQDNASV